MPPKLDAPHVEADLVKGLQTNPGDLHNVFQELTQLRMQEGDSAFKNDLTKINKDLEDLFKKGLLPHVQIVEDNSNPDGFKLDPLLDPPKKKPEIPLTPPVKDNVNPGAGSDSSSGGGSGGGSSGGSSGGSGGGGVGGDGGGGSRGGGGGVGGSSAGGDTSAGSTAIPSGPTDVGNVDGMAFPLPKGSASGEGSWSIDQGVDIAAAGHTPLYAIASGTVEYKAISGFGDHVPLLHVDSGPFAGKTIYYGHAGPAGLANGTHVTAGQQIGEVGAGIVGHSTGPHLEIGVYDSLSQGSGNPSAHQISDFLHKTYHNPQTAAKPSGHA